MSSLKRSVNLLLGAGLGQGMLFAAYTYGMLSNAETIGYLSTSLGIVVLLVMCLEYGGGVILRQFNNDQYLANKVVSILYCRLMLLALMLAVVGIVFTFDLVHDYVEKFIQASLIGVVFSIFNFTGFLDVKSKYSLHALLSGLHLMLLSVFIVLDGKDPVVAGGLVSLGLLINFVVHLVAVFLWAKKDSVRFVLKRHSLREVVREGGYVMLASLPGQILPRFFGVFLLEFGGAITAAVYNYLKLVQGLFNQAVTILRRAEYPRLIPFYRQQFALADFMSAQRLSVIASFIGVALVSSLFLFHEQMVLDYGSILMIIGQSIVWFGTSLYFLWLQVQQNNKAQGFYGVLIVIIAIVLFYIVNPYDALTIIAVEIVSALLAFVVVLFLSRGRDAKHSHC